MVGRKELGLRQLKKIFNQLELNIDMTYEKGEV